ncbi:D-amino acid dehydrogenase [Acidisoma cellulosilytica]|uniref:D-amino acid dehydrogenase n=1 Tax=Acidisoma cellulosilyticum TaxID=2802395 RepID=A0A963YZ71_9PROT|nr:D-amino acid dehydrogenase [Acidisoma cellulosilyticum]MCB8878900.1 D-amino acid dehydrogenase [Acidisoma cellulosilyticum]
MKRIAIVGAGVTGITTAYSLLKRGFDVTVFDRHRYAGMETSFANGGQLSASNAEVWNSWATLFKGVKWMLKTDAPLLVNPAPSWHKYSWMAEFVAQIPHYRRNTIETVKLAIASRRFLDETAETEGIDFDREPRGILHIYRDKKSFDGAARVNKLYAEGGLDRVAVTPAEIRAIEPALSGDFYGGFFTESDYTGDIHSFTRGLAAVCAKRGATFHHDVTVGQLEHTQAGVDVTWTPAHASGPVEKERFDGIVICAGVASRQFAAQLGDRVNIYPVKGYSITIPLIGPESRRAAPWVSLLDDGAKIVSSRYEDRLRVAGTAEFNGYNRDIRADRIRPLEHWTRQLFPGIDTSGAIPWAGLRPMLPSMLPRVGPGRAPGVFYNTGHGHLGWTLSAVTAEMVADSIMNNAALGASQAPGMTMPKPRQAGPTQAAG